MAASVGAIVANIYYAQPLLPDIARTFGLSAADSAYSLVPRLITGLWLGFGKARVSLHTPAKLRGLARNVQVTIDSPGLSPVESPLHPLANCVHLKWQRVRRYEYVAAGGAFPASPEL